MVAQRRIGLKSFFALGIGLAWTSFLAKPIQAYSVLTHEAIVDTLWEDQIKGLLLKRFPTATADQLIEAHGYAYGGSIIQDLGYYPFGSHFFSDMVHYVRTGDFVEALVRDAQDLNQYAFALGALCHYAADNQGHPVAVNRSVPILYPKLQAKFGNEVTYADDPAAHLKTEFGFDVLQVARGRYAPKSYHDFIGFQVSKPLLDQAFLETYDIQLKDVFKTLDLALGTYRRSVSSLIPEMTKAAWALKKGDIEKQTPGITRQKFLYNLSRASYRKEWGNDYTRPGIWARFIAFLFRIVPKVGPFKALAFKPPTKQTEAFFESSFDLTIDREKQNLAAVRADRLKLPNMDFDTGKPSSAGEYSLADKTYSKLLAKLSDKKLEGLTPELRANILGFYHGTTPKDDPKAAGALESLKTTGRPISK